MKQFIITGATGYIGYVLVEKLLKKGYKPLKLLVRSQKSVDRFKDLDVEAVIGSLLDENYLSEHITTGSVVFHLAGVINITSFNKAEVYETNYTATKLIADVCIKNNAEKLIYVSSSSAISTNKKEKLIAEPTTPLEPNKVIGHYAKSKAMATNYILNKSKKGLLNATVAYPSAIIGPYDYFISSIGGVVLKYMNNKFPVYIKGKYNFVDVRDVADGLIKCYENGKNGQDYLLTGESVTLKEMFVILNEILKRDKMPIKIPLFLVYLILPFVSLYNLIFKKATVFTKTSLQILNLPSNFNNELAKKDLNFKPISAKQSFTDMINWFYNEKYDSK